MRIETAFLPDAYRDELMALARRNARSLGISDAHWTKWRKGFGLGRDLLMAVDPDGEATRIRKARKHRS